MLYSCQLALVSESVGRGQRGTVLQPDIGTGKLVKLGKLASALPLKADILSIKRGQSQ
jgi:hypothetical protein